MIEVEVRTPDQMGALGAHIARLLRAGDLVALDGALGAGKTTLTRGIGRALGVVGTVASPTFVLARTHRRAPGLPPLVHVDAYRLGSAAELDDLDIDFAQSIVVVEWAAGMLAGLDDSVLEITIERPTGAPRDHAGESDMRHGLEPIEPRHVTISPRGERWRAHPFEPVELL